MSQFYVWLLLIKQVSSSAYKIVIIFYQYFVKRVNQSQMQDPSKEGSTRCSRKMRYLLFQPLPISTVRWKCWKESLPWSSVLWRINYSNTKTRVIICSCFTQCLSRRAFVTLSCKLSAGFFSFAAAAKCWCILTKTLIQFTDTLHKELPIWNIGRNLGRFKWCEGQIHLATQLTMGGAKNWELKAKDSKWRTP